MQRASLMSVLVAISWFFIALLFSPRFAAKPVASLAHGLKPRDRLPLMSVADQLGRKVILSDF
jgi:hypothetical protein